MDYLRFLRGNAQWLAAGFLLSFTSSYGQTYFISVFSGEIMAGFGLSYGQWGLSYTIGTTASALVMIWAGTLTDRFRVRALAPIVFACLAASCAFMALNPLALLLPLVIFCLRLTGQSMSSHLASVAMSRWFSSNRGRALAIATMGFAVGQAVLPLGFVRAKLWFDWHTLWFIAGGMALLAALPLLLLLRQERTPQSIAESESTTGMDGRHWRRQEMLRHPFFWFLVPALVGPAAWNTALFFQQVNLIEVKGWAPDAFVSLIPLFTLVSVASTFGCGWAIDRFGAGWIMAAQGLPLALGYTIFWNSDNPGGAQLAMMLIGLSTGSMGPLIGSLAAEYFGTRNIGGIKSIWAALMIFGSAVGPGLTGWLIDLGLSFPDQMLGFGGYFVASSLMVFVAVSRVRRMSAAAT